MVADIHYHGLTPSHFYRVQMKNPKLKNDVDGIRVVTVCSQNTLPKLLGKNQEIA